jgi:hypothetical protein
MARITTIYDEEGVEIQLPWCWEICGGCRGHGKSSRYLGAITMSDREPGGAWDDPEDFEDYMAGHYDRQCDDCDGTGKVQVVDEHQLTEEQLRAWKADVAEEREYEAMVAAERRAGA